jgi:glycosyltransferase involved in cell wall biosynthesis
MRIVVIGNFAPSNYQTQIDTLARHFEAEGIEVLRTSVRRGRVEKGVDVLRTLTLPAGGIRAVDVVVAQLHTDFSFAFGLLSVMTGALSGVPVILLYHGSWSRLGSAQALLQKYRWLFVPMFRRAFDVQVASPYLGGALQEIGVRSTVVPHVLDDRWVPQPPRTKIRPRILWPRVFHDIYDPHMALRVFERVRARRPDAQMTMVGRGPLFEEVRQRIAERGIEGIVLKDNLPVSELRDEMLSHDIYLHTNRFDNQPLTLIEAMSTGMVAVTSNAGGMPHVFAAGEGGFQVDSGDDEAAANRVLGFLEDDALFARTSARATEVAARHRWERLRLPWLDVLGRARDARRR